MANIRAHVVISGRVQGVFFRQYTKETAKELSVLGWVRNTADGNVESIFEGPENRVKELLLWCKQGPKLAVVDQVSVEYEQTTGEFTDFKIKH